MKHLFLTGPSGVGKSTLLMEVLQRCGQPVSGLFTQRLLSANGDTAGFRLRPWAPGLSPSAPYHPDAADIFIRKTALGWEKDIGVFADTGVKLLEAAADTKGIVCLDELGGAELLVPAFRRRLYQLLASHPCCTGVVKGNENLHTMLHTLPIASDDALSLGQFHRDLTGLLYSRIVNVTPTNKEPTAAALRSFLLRGKADDI